jgi:hypothetical protein
MRRRKLSAGLERLEPRLLLSNAPLNDVYPGAQTTVENVPVIFSSQNNNELAASAATTDVGLSVSSGTLTLSTTSGLTFIDGTANGASTLEFQGSVTALNAALNGLVFKPGTNFTGSDPLTFITAVQVAGLATVFTTNTVAMTVTPAPPTVATAAAASPSPVTGVSTALSVLGADDAGESSLTYTWATIPGAPEPAPVTFSANGTNAAKNTTATFSKAGTYSFEVTITDGAGLSVTSSVSATVDQTLTSISVSPATKTLNENQTQQFSALGYDQFGNAMASQPSFTWSKAFGVGSVSSQGLFTAPYGTGSASVTATSGSVSGSASITVANAAPTVAVAAAATPGTVTGTSTALSVLGADDGVEANLTYSWSVTAKPAGAQSPSFSVNGSNSAQNTTATFNQAGTYVLDATITDAGGLSTTSSVTVTVDQTLTSVVVSPANTSLGAGGIQQFNATALDQFGVSMNMQPSFSWGASNGVIDSTGHYVAPPTSGSVTVSATTGSFVGSTTVTIVGSNTAIASPTTVTGNTTTLSVVGGATSGVTYTWSILNEPLGAADPTFSTNASSAAQTTTATFSAAGNYTFQVAIDSGVTTTQDVSVTVNQTLTSIDVSPGTSHLNENGRQAFTATGFDQFGVAMSAQPGFSWAVSSGRGTIDGSGHYTAAGSGGAGSATISATSGSVTGSATVSVANAAPTVATAAAAWPSPVSGTSTLLSVLGADDGGESNLTYTWSAISAPPAPVVFSANASNDAKDTTATFTKAGDYHFLVTITDAEGLTVTSTVNVSVSQTLTALALHPGLPTVIEGASRQFSVTATDQFGDSMSAPSLIWSVQSGGGSIDSAGLFTAGDTAGIATVLASSDDVSATATVTIPNEPPTVAIAAAATSSLVTGTSAGLSVLGADDGGESNLTYTWSTVGTPPAAVSFSDNSTNDAKNVTASFSASGNYDLLVTITDAEGATVTSSVNVTVRAVLSSVRLAPANATLGRAEKLQFSAVACDQFGAALSSQPAVVWSTVGSVGSIDASGLFTAPTAGGGPVTIVATTGNVSATTTLNLVDDLSASAPALVVTKPGAAVIFANGDAIQISDGDPQTVSVPVSITVVASNGKIKLGETSGLTFMDGTESSGTRVTFSGSIADVNDALRAMTYTADSAGTGSLTVTINETGTGNVSPSYFIPIDAVSSAIYHWNGGNDSTDTGGSASNNADPDNLINGGSTQSNVNPVSPPADSGGGGSSGDATIDGGSSTPAASPVAPPAQKPAANPPPPTKPTVATAAPAPKPSQAATVSPTAGLAMASAPNDAVPDVRVSSVPEQVFSFLSPKSEMSQELDTAHDNLVADRKLKVVAGSATVASFGASAAYVLWMVRGGSLLSSLMSILPAWKSIDPVPVLDSFEGRKRRNKRMKSDGESLESMVDKSNDEAARADVTGKDSQ